MTVVGTDVHRDTIAIALLRPGEQVPLEQTHREHAGGGAQAAAPLGHPESLPVCYEAGHARPYRSEAARDRALRHFDYHHNFVRRYGELGGLTPRQGLADDLVNNVPGQNS